MKELSIEEKAKAYDEAIKVAVAAHKDEDKHLKATLERIFPELKESEDEKMMHQLYSWMKEFGGAEEYTEKVYTWLKSLIEKQGTSYTKKDVDDADAYVEGMAFAKDELDKQGEQKPADKVELKFNVSDWIITNQNRVGIIVRILDEHYIVSFDGREVQISFEWEGKLFRKWSIKDAKDGDVLAESKGDVILMFRGIGNERWDDVIDYHFYYDCYRENFIVQEDVNYWGNTKNNQLKPATKEQRDTLFAKMKEAGYEWDAEKKELKKIELTDVGHEYYSELLKNDKSDNIADYAYQCVYCMSHDWTIESPTWDNVQSACRLGAKWQKKHNVSEDWSEEDEKVSKYALDIPQNWTKEDKERYISCLQRLSTGNPEQPETINSKWFKEHVYPQKQWKPSDEQIRALEYIINNAHNTSYSCKIAKELLEQLRKLKGE